MNEDTKHIDAELAKMGLELTDEGRKFYVDFMLDGLNVPKPEPGTMLRKIGVQDGKPA